MVTLTTERLVLRPFRRSDAAEFTRLAGDWAVASMTSDIPHPLTQAQAHGLAQAGTGRGALRHRAGRPADRRRGLLPAALGRGRTRLLAGPALVGPRLRHRGHPRRACATASRCARLPGFTSSHFVDNCASAGVLRKLGFEPMGRGLIICAARGHEVEAVTYWLPAKSAVHTSRCAERRAAAPRWRAWLGRLAGRPV